MKPISHADLVTLLRPHDPPCVSIHVPVDAREGSGPASRKLLNAARSLRPKLDAWPGSAEVSRSLDGIVESLGEQPWEGADGAWRAPTRGLALFVSPGFSIIHRLTEPPPESSSCDAVFHARPVLDQHACDVPFHLLAIHRDGVRLFHGCAERLESLPLGDVPASMDQAVGRAWDDSHQGYGFHGSPQPGKKRGNAEAQGVHSHGYGGSDRDEEKDRTRFLLRIGHGLPRGMGDASGIPLVVVAVAKTLGEFKKLHPNIQLAEGGLDVDPGLLTPEQLHARAWPLLQRVRESRLGTALEAIDAGTPRGRASKDLEAIARAAVTGRVGTLVLAQGKRDAGRFDTITGELSLDGPGHDGADVLEQIAAAVLLSRGEVLLASADRLHSHAGALFRY